MPNACEDPECRTPNSRMKNELQCAACYMRDYRAKRSPAKKRADRDQDRMAKRKRDHPPKSIPVTSDDDPPDQEPNVFDMSLYKIATHPQFTQGVAATLLRIVHDKRAMDDPESTQTLVKQELELMYDFLRDNALDAPFYAYLETRGIFTPEEHETKKPSAGPPTQV